MVGPNEYALYLCNDTNTGGHRQWFYFAVNNAVKKVKYRFHIVNMSAHQPLLCAGMRPLLYSESRAADGIGWRRAAVSSHFSETDLQSKPGLEEVEGGYTLSFTMELSGHGVNYIAYQIPYSLRDLRIDLSKYVGDPHTGKFAHWSSLCTTMNGHRVDVLTITNQAPVICEQCQKDWIREAVAFKEAERQLVVLIARMRPGSLASMSWELAEYCGTICRRVIGLLHRVWCDGISSGNQRGGSAPQAEVCVQNRTRTQSRR